MLPSILSPIHEYTGWPLSRKMLCVFWSRQLFKIRPVCLQFTKQSHNHNNISNMDFKEELSSDEVSCDIIKEGKAEVQIPGGNVFYNPVQEFNRDLSVAVLHLEVERFQNGKESKSKDYRDGREKFTILEALSASGLRSIRYAKEVPGISEVIANDLSQKAVQTIEKNVENNGVSNIVTTSCSDASAVMFENRNLGNRFHVIDLDPYGCPSQFLDSAVQSVCNGGMLMVTCTDMAVLCGNSPETCYVKYGAIALRNVACHEMALRIVLQCIESNANRYKRYIVPVLSVSVDFYVRVFVRVFSSAEKCKETTSKLSMVYQCNGCGSVTYQPLGQIKVTGEKGKEKKSYSLPSAPCVDKQCIHCDGKHHIGGPIWTAPIHDFQYVSDLLLLLEKVDLATKKKLVGILSLIKEELPDVPLYYTADKLFSIVHAGIQPMMEIRSAILNGGHRVSYSHACKNSIKTDAPMKFILDMVRQSVKNSQKLSNKVKPGCPSFKILNTPIENKINFLLRKDANPLSREIGLSRFPENPARFWGPGTRSKLNTEKPPKSEAKQNKKKRKQELQNGQDGNPSKVVKETEIETEL